MPEPTYAYIQNLTEVMKPIQPESIISRMINKDPNAKVTLFGFDAGQELTEHTASMPAILLFLEGQADLTLGDEHRQAEPGTWVHMPAKMPHSIYAKTPVVMVLFMYPEG